MYGDVFFLLHQNGAYPISQNQLKKREFTGLVKQIWTLNFYFQVRKTFIFGGQNLDEELQMLYQ
jgi:hypothetical protein